MGISSRVNDLTRAIPSLSAESIQAANGGPGIYADGGCELLEAEPCAGLIGAYLKCHALSKNVDGQLEILYRGRAERERLLRLRHARGIGEAGQR